jgi:RHS repeat-associated protein
LNWYYFGARYYDPAIGRWLEHSGSPDLSGLSVDPLADDYPAWSPYNYVKNNPLIIVDKDGNAGFKLNFDGFFAGGIFNATGGVAIGYDKDRNSVFIEGHFGFGPSRLTKGVDLGPYVRGEYYSGTLAESTKPQVYFIANYGPIQGKLTAPVESIEAVKGFIPNVKEMKKIIKDGSVSFQVGGGTGGGLSTAGGIEKSKIFVEIKLGNNKNYIELKNQKGDAPADATNVRVEKPNNYSFDNSSDKLIRDETYDR